MKRVNRTFSFNPVFTILLFKSKYIGRRIKLLAENYSSYCKISCLGKGTSNFVKCGPVDVIVLINVCQYYIFDIMKLKIPFLLNCEFPKYIAKLSPLSI